MRSLTATFTPVVAPQISITDCGALTPLAASLAWQLVGGQAEKKIRKIHVQICPHLAGFAQKVSYSELSVDCRPDEDQPGRARRTRWRQRLTGTATRLLAFRSRTISSAVWPAAPPAIKAPSVARAAASTGSIGGADPSSSAGSDPSPGRLPSEERSPTMFTPSASMR